MAQEDDKKIRFGVKGMGVSGNLNQMIPFCGIKSHLATPSDTEELPEEFRGGNLFVNKSDFDKVQVTLVLWGDDTEQTMYLEPGYHPLHVKQIKATNTSTDASYIVLM